MKRKSIKKNALLNTTKQLFSILFPFISVPYITRVLGPEKYGNINYGISIANYFVLIAGLGIGNYAIREGARFRDDKDKFSKFASEMFSINIFSSFVAYLSLAILLIISEKTKAYSNIILIQSISIVLFLFGMEWVNSVYEEYTYITLRYIIIHFLSLLAMLICVRQPEDYIIYAWITLLAGAGGNLLNIYYIRKRVKISLIINKDLMDHIKPIMLIFVSTLTVTIYVNADITMLGIWRTQKEVGIYGLSSKVYAIIKQLINALIIVTVPRLSSALGEGDKKKFIDLSEKVMGILLTIALPAGCGVVMLGKEITLIAGGKKYLSGSLSMSILGVALMFSVIASFYYSCVLLSLRKDTLIFIASMAGAISNVILNVWLIPAMGMNGAAITTLVAEILVATVYCWKSKCYLKTSLINKRILIAAILGSVIICLICGLFKQIIFNDYLRVFVSTSVSVIVYFAIQLITKNPSIINMLETMHILKKRI